MAIHIQIRRLDKDFGKDSWEAQIGDIEGALTLFNVSRRKVIAAIKGEMKLIRGLK